MLVLAVSATVFAQRRRPETASFDIIIKGGTVYDGSGRPPRRADVGIKGDRIAAVGNLSRASSLTIIDAKGQAVARGFLKPGMFADVVVFDPQTIADRATFGSPHQLSVGVKDVFVNGTQVLKDGEHTGAKPGRALWGPGKTM